MSDDLLERAARIARERYDGRSKPDSRTEERVLAAVARQTRRPRRFALVAIPLVAALLASAAWASVGEGLRAWLQTSSHGPHASSTPRPAKVVAPSRLGPSPPPSAPAAASAPLSEPVAPPPLAVAPSARPQHLAALPRALSPPRPQPVASEVEIGALYRAAHRAQFSGGDPSLALLLWDRYLAAAPNGSLSPEARYNRAIALARLGRNAEAAAALEPFARGDYGGYRRSEAQSLLEALRPSAPP
jgi:hypothetical protein